MCNKLKYYLLYLLLLSHGILGCKILAQSDYQAWSNLILGYNLANQIYIEGDFEYKSLISDSEDQWTNSSFTLKGEYYPSRLLDFTIDITGGKTKQLNDLTSSEAAQKIGIKGYILQRGHNLFRLSKKFEGAPQRIELSNSIQFEHRSFDYYNDLPPDDNWRFRNRTQFIIALNKKTFSETRMVRLLTDIEFFIPLGSEITERYASKYRFRIGPGYRHNLHWRANLFYILDSSRDNIEANFEQSNHVLNLQLSYIF